MEKISQKVARSLVENGNIRKEHEAVYQYALQSVLILGTNVLLSLLVGIVMGKIGYCMLFLCIMIPLRSNAGGYHAPNLVLCYIMSFTSLITTLLLADMDSLFGSVLLAAAAVVSAVFIFKYAPLDTKNRRLDENEKQRIGGKARWIVGAELLTGFLLLTVSSAVSYVIWGCILWCAVGYIAWFIEQRAETREKTKKNEIS